MEEKDRRTVAAETNSPSSNNAPDHDVPRNEADTDKDNNNKPSSSKRKREDSDSDLEYGKSKK
jgi:hypothetical protein